MADTRTPAVLLALITPELLTELRNLAEMIRHMGSPSLIKQSHRVALVFKEALSVGPEDDRWRSYWTPR